MSRIRHFRRLAGVLAGLTSALLAFAATAPAALASTSPGRTWPLSWADPPLPLRHGAGPVPVYQVPARTDVTGATPWQIAVIAAVAGWQWPPSWCCWTGRAAGRTTVTA